MSTVTARPDRPARAGAATAAPARHRRLPDAAARRGVPLATILVTVAVVVLTYLAGKLAYRIRDVLLMIAVAGFLSLILNPWWWPCSGGGSHAAAGPWPSWPPGPWSSSPACWRRSAIRWRTA